MNDTKENLTAPARVLRACFCRLAEAFTEHHKFLVIEANQSANFISLNPRAHKDDVAKLIGVDGASFHAMKVLMNVVADRLGVRFHLSRIKVFAGTEKSAELPARVLRPDWPRHDIMRLALETCADLFEKMPQVSWEHDDALSGSVLDIVLSPDERLSLPDDALCDCLDHIFHAIGNAKGRIIRVRLTRGNLTNHETASDRGREPHVPR